MGMAQQGWKVPYVRVLIGIYATKYFRFRKPMDRRLLCENGGIAFCLAWHSWHPQAPQTPRQSIRSEIQVRTDAPRPPTDLSTSSQHRRPKEASDDGKADALLMPLFGTRKGFERHRSSVPAKSKTAPKIVFKC